jgi:tetratricopeptide (TPR) repeat protein
MSPEERQPPPSEDALVELLARYIDRLLAGEQLDPEEVRREHPELAAALLEELRTFAALKPKAADAAPAAFGDYDVVREIGRGGMGVVYEARDRAMERAVALKVLPQDLLSDTRAVARFVQEARIAGRLQHPNVVSVYGMGIDRGAPYFVMELVHGKTLSSLLGEHAPRTPRTDDNDWTRAVTSLSPLLALAGETPAAPGRVDVDLTYCLRIARTFAELAEGLQHAHEQGILHRDLKPSNLIVDDGGRPRILDFGLARLEGQASLTRSRDIVGTPLYMSPEQVDTASGRPDQRADIYSLGASLYEMLVFEPPFQGRSHQETLSRILHDEPRPPRQLCPRIPRDLETIVLKCLEKDPESRYRTAEALAQDLRRLVRGDPIEARPRSSWERFGRRCWRRKGRLAAAAGAVLLAATTGLLLRSYREADVRLRESAYRRKVVEAVLLLEYAAARSGETAASAPLPAAIEAYGASRTGALDFVSTPPPRPDPAAEALPLLEEASRLFPAAPEAAFYRARALRRLGRDEQSRAVLAGLAAGEAPFVPAAIWLEIHGEQTEPAGVNSAPLARASWVAAYEEAHRAVERRDWLAAAAGFSSLIRAVALDGEPYIGALLAARLERGRARIELESHDEALEDFAAAEALAPAALEPALLVATVYHLKGRQDLAEARLQALFENTPVKDLAAARIAALEQDFARYAQALAWAERLPPGPRRDQLRVASLVPLGRAGEALEAARSAVRLSPESALAHNTLGWILASGRQADEALACFRRVLELEPDHAMAHNNIGWAHVVKGELDEAMAAADRALELAPRLEWPYIVRGACHLRRGEPEKALEEYRRIIAVNPRSALGHSHVAIAQERLRRPQEAAAAYRRAIECNPHDLRSLYNLANLLSGLGRFDEAVPWYERALEVRPGDDFAHNNLGIALFQLGRLDEAGKHFAAAIAAAPESPDAHFNLAAVLEKQGDLAGAIARLEHGIPLAAGDPRPLGQLSAWQERSGNLAAAVETRARELEVHEQRLARAQGATRLVEDFLQALDGAARLFLKAGDAARARSSATRALGLRRERAEREGATAGALNDYAWSLLVCEPADLQDPGVSLAWAEKAVAASEGKDPGVLDTLALAAFRTGNPERAAELETRALDLLPPAGKGPDVEEMRQELETRLREYRQALAGQRNGK